MTPLGNLTADVDIRTSRLTKLFHDVLNGKRALNASKDGKLFIEAICAQVDQAACTHKLVTSRNGLAAIQSSVRLDTGPSFINKHAVQLLRYLEDPSVKGIESGSLLGRILTSIVDPPFFWDAFTQAFRGHLLTPAAVQSFAWLLLQLIYLPGNASCSYVALAKSSDILDPILKSQDGETRILGQKIKHSLSLTSPDLHIDAEVKPGGRHDNDHLDHRNIKIMPTADELLSQERPFLRTADFIDDPGMAPSLRALHVDNQFRLLREDMLGDIREEIQILTGGKPGRHKGLTVDGLQLVGVDIGTDRKKHRPWGIVLRCATALPHLEKIDPIKRKAYLEDNRHILRHGNMACLLVDNDPVAFPTIHRDDEELSKTPAKLAIQFQNDSTLEHALSKIKTSSNIKVVQLDTAVFAFQPFLNQLQEMKELPLSEELLYWEEEKALLRPSFLPIRIINSIRKRGEEDLQDLLLTTKIVKLDESQMDSLCASLSQRVSLVQGPPGTGKSFIGALVAKVLHDSTSQVILVVCFTNHALDQFLEDLMDIGIPASRMIRLGGKCTDVTKPLTMREQGGSKLTPTQWDQIRKAEIKLQEHEKGLRHAFTRFSANTSKQQIMDYLEFADEDLPFHEAFAMPEESNGTTIIGSKGKAVSKFYLLDRWMRGGHAGPFQHLVPKGADAVWRMSPETRAAAHARWQAAILEDLVSEIKRIGADFNKDEAEMDRIFSQRDTNVIKQKRIIACTTNGAAKFARAIQAAAPSVVLVEEAGEILEAHILTAMGPHTEQLILIGDHQQLRPKCSYELGVDGGSGYDFDRSLFERLVRKGLPHTTLTKQHRMRPEISSIIREMTYPDLTDAGSTLNRPNLRGFQDNVMFINHSELEVELEGSREMRDGSSTSSKQNLFEAGMVLKCVRYLAQQGYGSDKIVVLTPYLGQLKLLRDQLSKENDPILNDIDKFDLIRAGLLTAVSSKSSKPSLRISTIDNYQGEESEIVIISLTRSNKSRDIGFMKSPERLNVLVSRARDALILIGNSETFLHARRGADVWRKFLDHLKQKGHFYEGYPIKCEKHPTTTAMLTSPEDFDVQCPDGGCKEPCGVLLKCGIHKCPSSCHQLFDHNKMKCMAMLKQKCTKGHSQIWRCDWGGSAPSTCEQCEKERKDAEKQARKIAEYQQRKEAKMQKHLREVAKIQDEIDKINQSIKDAHLDAGNEKILAQKRKDLAAAKEMAQKATQNNFQQHSVATSAGSSPIPAQPASTSSSPRPRVNTSPSNLTDPQSSTAQPVNSSQSSKATAASKKTTSKKLSLASSPSKIEWERQKAHEGAVNLAIDKIMEMVGLEDVKSQVLRIKSKVDTSIRQGTDLTKERLGLTLLGNPGTGKTTVARHYAQVLTSLGVLSGHGFVETTGSGLAHGGVSEVKGHLNTLDKSDGGVYFIDEAYQLTEGHNAGGKTVLDFLLAEIENLVGRIVFVFAGYRKQMEKFFEHNPGLPSRIPYTLYFEDYTDAELLTMLQYQIGQFYKSPMGVEDGMDGLYMRISIRRLGRGRGREGFGNARALENLFARIRERQSDRLTKQRRDGLGPDDHYITKEDLIGPDPSQAILTCEAWDQLQKLTGLKSVKDSVSFMIDLIKTNYKREIQERPPIEVSLNRVFLGSPGTGKTTIAKLYGKILADIGLLSNGEVVSKNPADFIGAVLGASEANTKAILARAIGKVLIIDEAYMLYPDAGSGNGTGSTDPFKTAVIDTIVAEVQSTLGEDRCVLLLGYEPQMVKMFQNVNPGLTRRFQLSDAFRFEDFSDAELREILEQKLENQGLGATTQAVSVAIDTLGRARNGLNFGNGGDVENLISKAKGNYQARQSKLPAADRSIDFMFEPQDFDPNFDRASGAESNLQELFKGVIGCESIIQKLDGYLRFAKGMRAQGLDPRCQIPMNFVFKGPPGTGKTTTARKFGQVYYDLGFLSQVEVVECSTTDLIGSYVGHTGPKTIKQLERGLGKVLFIDEAYRLGEGHFAQEAINELVDSITKPQFAGKMIIILAGYENDMNNLLRVNEGLSSRFADEITFPSLSPEKCLELLVTKLKENKVVAPTLQNPLASSKFLDIITEISALPAWGNARDVQTLAKSMVRSVYQDNPSKVDQLTLSDEKALECFEVMLTGKRGRNQNAPSSRPPVHAQVKLASDSQRQPPVSVNTSTSTTSNQDSSDPPEETEETKVAPPNSPGDGDGIRDAGVSDEIWLQLQKDKQAERLHAEQMQKIIRDQEEAVKVAKEMEKKLAAEAAALQNSQAADDSESMKLLQQREEARIKEFDAKARRERMQEELEVQRKAELERKRMEAKMQAKLQQMGCCPAGYRWIKQSGGYRCAGGSHWLPDGQMKT